MVVVVSDTSPITNLAAIGQLDLLRQLYKVVVIPAAVYAELTRPPASVGADEAIRGVWIQVRAASRLNLSRIEKYGLDRGETEAIALAIDLAADQTLIDERRGRNVASEVGISFTGVVGVLILSKRRGLIPEVRTLLDDLRQLGFRLSEDVYKQALALAQED